MVSRSLTEVFLLMRNNAIHSRHIFAEQGSQSERVRLMRSSSQDAEAGIELRSESNAPPPWTDALEELHYVITRLKTKLSELQARHERQIRRPALDDTSEQQHIGRLTAEIGRHFTHAHTHLTAIKAQMRHENLNSEVHYEAGKVRQIRAALDDTSEQQHIGRLTAEIGRHFTHAHTHLTAIKAQMRHENLNSGVHYEAGKVRQFRPALDDTSEQQHIGRLTAEIGRHFTHAHTHLTAIKAQMRHGSKTEQKLTANVVLALVTTLQELSITFRTAQSNYLRSLTSREERSNAYFDLPNFEELSLNDNELLPGLSNNQTDLLFSLPSTSGAQKGYIEDEQSDTFERQALSQKQLLLLQEENTKMVTEREEEVNKIVRSIMDLNEIFKDLGHMVHEQGTILDRIDYNIEQTQTQVYEGFKQLQKADSYHRKNRKMHCILILAVVVIVLVVLLIIVKS